MMSLFHEGERKMQALAGETEEADLNAPMIVPHILKGAIPFLASQSFAVLGLEHDGEIWTTYLIGQPGFISAPDQLRIHFDLGRLHAELDPAISATARLRQPVGGIFIDLETRRRYRVNGTLSQISPEVVELRVREAFVNCPKYITRRIIQWESQGSEPSSGPTGESLSDEGAATLRSADLFFIATNHPDRGLDASHRGGDPGFITVTDRRTFRFPDYPGNSLFNSLGNLLVDNRIGLLVPDLKRRVALRITGTAAVKLQNSTHELSTNNAPRMVEVSISRWEETAFPLRTIPVVEYSPFNPQGRFCDVVR